MADLVLALMAVLVLSVALKGALLGLRFLTWPLRWWRR